ncbi:hypothetical protein F511_20770 [Dorcoceras hygrometricum]|uniref:Uncharacterized protein n=1 Tax=Dorcoceras hygrometricum TaxID=472368 RepID=A0A2Z7A6X0_9LAMI|nr:hypothetical protein F511_20770 [Dorcoceras hygrometricum]
MGTIEPAWDDRTSLGRSNQLGAINQLGMFKPARGDQPAWYGQISSGRSNRLGMVKPARDSQTSLAWSNQLTCSDKKRAEESTVPEQSELMKSIVADQITRELQAVEKMSKLEPKLEFPDVSFDEVWSSADEVKSG